MIRFDTAKSTVLADVGEDGKVYNNVAWGGPALVVKGDSHKLFDNTVIGTVEVVRDWGAACGQNVNTKVEDNLAREFNFRGSCKLKGKDISGPPSAPEGSFKGNKDVSDPCSELRDCDAMDFRPRTLAAGAYPVATDKPQNYSIPGVRSSEPTLFTVSGFEKETALIFQPARGCEKSHRVYVLD